MRIGLIWGNVYKCNLPGPVSCFSLKPVIRGMGISIMKIWWSWDHLFFIMGILILLRQHLCTETAPRAASLHSGTVLIILMFVFSMSLTHWGRVTHICVGNLTIIGSDNGLSPGRRQAIIWNNAGLLLIEPLGTNFSEISIGVQTFSFKKMHLNMSSAKWRPFCLSLNVLKR